MSDDTTNDTDDPVQADEVVKEAAALSGDNAGAEEAGSVEALTQSFEDYVRNYQDTWQQTWQDSIAEYEQDVENWQNIIAGSQGKTRQAKGSTPPPPPPPTPTSATPTPASAKKTKSQKSGS